MAASSLISSAMMSCASWIAVCASGTPFSSSMYAAASFIGSSPRRCAMIALASGSTPFSRAIIARVRRLGLNGR